MASAIMINNINDSNARERLRKITRMEGGKSAPLGKSTNDESLSSSNSSAMNYSRKSRMRTDSDSGIQISPLPVILINEESYSKGSYSDSRETKPSRGNMDNNEGESIIETSNAVSSFPSASYDIENQPHQPIYDAGYQVLDILSREIYILEMYRINQNVK